MSRAQTFLVPAFVAVLALLGSWYTGEPWRVGVAMRAFMGAGPSEMMH
jgi:hypothetical protein